MGSPIITPTMHQLTIAYKVMHRPQLVTWTTHTAETTTLLDYRKLYTYMCNIVTELYLYSIVYIYLINSRLDVTFSVRHFHIETLSWCQISGKIFV